MAEAAKISCVVCYDIPDDKRRSKLAQCLEALGDRVQYSVFEAVLPRPLFDKMVQQLQEIVDPEEDRIAIYRLCATCKERSVFLGLAEVEEAPGEEIVFIV